MLPQEARNEGDKLGWRGLQKGGAPCVSITLRWVSCGNEGIKNALYK